MSDIIYDQMTKLLPDDKNRSCLVWGLGRPSKQAGDNKGHARKVVSRIRSRIHGKINSAKTKTCLWV